MSNSTPSQPPPRVSVAVIVRDAEAILAATLDSVQGLADETLVLDTGSTDATVAIGRRCGAAVFEMPWLDDFSAAQSSFGTGHGRLDPVARCGRASGASRRSVVTGPRRPSPGCVRGLHDARGGAARSGRHFQRTSRPHPSRAPRADLRFQGRIRESLAPSLVAAGLRIEGLPWRILAAPPCPRSKRRERDEFAASRIGDRRRGARSAAARGPRRGARAAGRSGGAGGVCRSAAIECGRVDDPCARRFMAC